MAIAGEGAWATKKRGRAVTCYGSRRRCKQRLYRKAVASLRCKCSVTSALRVLVEADEDGFGGEADAKGVGHALLDLVFQGKDVVGSGVATVHDGQRVLARDAHPPLGVAPGKSGMFHQPGGRNLVLGAQRGIAGNRKAQCSSALAELLVLRLS